MTVAWRGNAPVTTPTPLFGPGARRRSAPSVTRTRPIARPPTARTSRSRRSSAPRLGGGMRRRPSDALAAGLTGAIVSGLPSTLYTLARGGDPLEGARALGHVLLPRSERTVALLAAGAPGHLALSLGWAAVFAAMLPPRAEPLTGTLAGLAVAGLDLGVLGRFFSPIAALPQGRQWADHAAFGFSVGAVLQWRHARDPDHQQGRP